MNYQLFAILVKWYYCDKSRFESYLFVWSDRKVTYTLQTNVYTAANMSIWLMEIYFSDRPPIRWVIILVHLTECHKDDI